MKDFVRFGELQIITLDENKIVQMRLKVGKGLFT